MSDSIFIKRENPSTTNALPKASAVSDGWMATATAASTISRNDKILMPGPERSPCAAPIRIRTSAPVARMSSGKINAKAGMLAVIVLSQGATAAVLTAAIAAWVCFRSSVVGAAKASSTCAG